MLIKKDYSIKESIFITERVLSAIFENYCFAYPKHIYDKVKELLDSLIEEIEKNYTNINDDIVSFEIIERITYDKRL